MTEKTMLELKGKMKNRFLCIHEEMQAIIEKLEICDLVNLLYYNLKYREYTQHSLELMVESFFVASNIQ